MPAAVESSVGVDGFCMRNYSQIANSRASKNVRRIDDALEAPFSQYADMDDEADKNGGPNHLRAWMKLRKMTGAKLAGLLDTTPGVVSDLMNSNRALSAKWLRRIAPHLETTPGMLLDHDPTELDSDVIDIWVNANNTQRQQLADVAKLLVRGAGGGV